MGGPMGGLRRILLAAIAAAILAVPATSSAAPAPGAYGDNDAGGFLNILPPGQGQSVNAAEIGAFLGTGTRPPHDSDQLQMYEDLVYATPGLEPEQLTQFYKDATFGVQPADVQAHLQPAGRRDHRPRQLRRPAHLRRVARRGDVRRRLHRRRGPDVLHRRPAPRGARRARLVRRRLGGQPRDGPQRLRRDAVPKRLRAAGPVRPRRRGLRADGVQVARGRRAVTSPGSTSGSPRSAPTRC